MRSTKPRAEFKVFKYRHAGAEKEMNALGKLGWRTVTAQTVVEPKVVGFRYPANGNRSEPIYEGQEIFIVGVMSREV